jgi:hypothetical protein
MSGLIVLNPSVSLGFPALGVAMSLPFSHASEGLVVAGRRQMADRADCGRTLARSHSDFDALLVGSEVSVLVNRTSETMAAV